ncbi:hypothetical protein ONS95_005624 [Cadophora gregata]|uniref:uncharacterized protein n=1 Tax=Cadophora gregata TaxID=51156 RepID=UPI0026DC83A0|nr:uncharacterized protein ONS95_005624 [Cadophora gregata]KAK0103612.1 hypothetical protein ONS95_005624 [Cadophora gregata]KAK0107804.1 hypothetical protein ONS96_003596 [Cadophora gregata f. sp. sojae]
MRMVSSTSKVPLHRWTRLKAFLSTKVNTIKFTPHSSTPSPYILKLPLEIRRLIYTHLSGSHPFSKPCSNPLTVLLHLNRQLRYEVSAFFFSFQSPGSSQHNHPLIPAFAFLNTTRALTFFHLTKSHLHLLKSLTVSVAFDNTFALEGLWRFLVERGVRLRRLEIRLGSVESFARGPPEETLIPRHVALDVLAKAREKMRELEVWFDREVGGSGVGGLDFYGEVGENESVRGVREASNVGASFDGDFGDFTSFLDRMTTLRSLKVVKRPLDGSPWAMEFEIAVIRVWMRMFEVAAGEGKCVRRKNLEGYMESYWWGNEVSVDFEERY